MRRHLLTLMMVLTLLSIAHHQATTHVIAQEAERKSKPDATLNRKTKLLNRLKTLLEPLGVSVVEADLIDVSKVKDISELAIKWEAYPHAGGGVVTPEKVKDHPVGKEMKMIKKAKRHDCLAEQFAFKLTSEQLFIVGVNAESQLKWWTVMRDPRVVYEDSIGPNGELTGGIRYDPSPYIFISLPDTPTITELLILQPRRAGEAFALDLLTRLPLQPE